jgi:hypothetical protein
MWNHPIQGDSICCGLKPATSLEGSWTEHWIHSLGYCIYKQCFTHLISPIYRAFETMVSNVVKKAANRSVAEFEKVILFTSTLSPGPQMPSFNSDGSFLCTQLVRTGQDFPKTFHSVYQRTPPMALVPIAHASISGQLRTLRPISSPYLYPI